MTCIAPLITLAGFFAAMAVGAYANYRFAKRLMRRP